MQMQGDQAGGSGRVRGTDDLNDFRVFIRSAESVLSHFGNDDVAVFRFARMGAVDNVVLMQTTIDG